MILLLLHLKQPRHWLTQYTRTHLFFIFTGAVLSQDRCDDGLCDVHCLLLLLQPQYRHVQACQQKKNPDYCNLAIIIDLRHSHCGSTPPRLQLLLFRSDGLRVGHGAHLFLLRGSVPYFVSVSSLIIVHRFWLSDVSLRPNLKFY